MSLREPPPRRRPPLLGSSSSTRGKTSFGGMPVYLWGPALGFGGTMAVCYFAFLDEAPLTKRKRWIATSPEFEQRMGEGEYKNMLKHFRRDILPPNHRASVTVQRVGSRIAQASQHFALQNQLAFSRSPFTYTVVRSDSANAFVLPNNHVFVLTGLFKYVRDEDELAAVLGHETAHLLARHAGEKMSGSLVVNLLARLLLLLDPSGGLSVIFLPAASLMKELPNSREAELEADRIGVHLAAEACYDPRAAKRVFARMQAGEGAAPPEFMSTHPSNASRISLLDKWVPDAMTTFESDMGDRCRHVRRDMALARRAASLQATHQEAAGGERRF